MYCSSSDCDSCNPEQECDECGLFYRGYCRECDEFESTLHLEFPLTFNRIQASIESGVVSFPRGLDREDRMDYIREQLGVTI